MTDWERALEELCQQAEHPKRTVEAEVRRTGKAAVGCFPPYAPVELVDAAGFLPVGLWGGPGISTQSEQYVQSFCCSIMKANLAQGLAGTYQGLAAVLIPAFCDTLKCVSENWKAALPGIPSITLVYPQNQRASGAAEYLKAEFQRVLARLRQLGGREASPDALEESFDCFERARAAQRELVRQASDHPRQVSVRQRHLALKASMFLDPRRYAEQLERVNQGLSAIAPDPACKVRLVATGIMLEPLSLLDVLDQSGICVAADDLAQESRQFSPCVGAGGSALDRMAARYLSRRGDPLVYDSAKSRGERLIQLVRDCQADGVLISMMKFCDPEEFDYPIYKKELERAGIPMLYLETELSIETAESFRTKAEAFCEIALERRQTR